MHEIADPLIVASNALENAESAAVNLLTPGDLEQIQPHFQKNRRALMTVQNIISSLRIIHQKSHQSIKKAFIPVTLQSILNGLEFQVAYFLQMENIHLETKSCDPLLKIIVFPEMIHRVLINLVMNAIQSFDGLELPLKKISITIVRQANILCFRISDNGSGIAKTKQDKIFQDAFSTKSKGCGLGLYFCQEIVKLHQGKLYLEKSIPGEGSTFIFCLPTDSNPISGRKNKLS